MSKNLDFNYYIGNAVIQGVNQTDFSSSREINTLCPETTINFGGPVTGTGPNNNNGTVINSTVSVTSTSTPFSGSSSYNSNGGGSSFTVGGLYFYTIKAPKIHRFSSPNHECPEALPPGYVSVNISQVALNNLKATLSLTPPQWRWFAQAGNDDKFEPFYLAYMSDATRNTTETKAFFKNALIQMIANPLLNLNYFLYNRTALNFNAAEDINNNTIGGYDTSTYSNFNPQQAWSNIPAVIPSNQFIGWGAPNIKRNCMDYAKAQIAKNGYQISNFAAAGQTIQIYTEQTGVNTSKLNNGLRY